MARAEVGPSLLLFALVDSDSTSIPVLPVVSRLLSRARDNERKSLHLGRAVPADEKRSPPLSCPAVARRPIPTIAAALCRAHSLRLMAPDGAGSVCGSGGGGGGDPSIGTGTSVELPPRLVLIIMLGTSRLAIEKMPRPRCGSTPSCDTTTLSRMRRIMRSLRTIEFVILSGQWPTGSTLSLHIGHRLLVVCRKSSTHSGWKM